MLGWAGKWSDPHLRLCCVCLCVALGGTGLRCSRLARALSNSGVGGCCGARDFQLLTRVRQRGGNTSEVLRATKGGAARSVSCCSGNSNGDPASGIRHFSAMRRGRPGFLASCSGTKSSCEPRAVDITRHELRKTCKVLVGKFCLTLLLCFILFTKTGETKLGRLNLISKPYSASPIKSLPFHSKLICFSSLY